jgi:hypothetical protein
LDEVVSELLRVPFPMLFSLALLFQSLLGHQARDRGTFGDVPRFLETLRPGSLGACLR